MQRKIPNINFRDKLHSIPISRMKNVKSNVLYSIPDVKHCAHFCRIYKPDNIYSRITGWAMAGFIFLMGVLCNSEDCFAVCGHNFCTGTISDKDTISTITSGTSTPPTASLSLSKTALTSDTAPGSVATTSTNVTVDVKNASSYSLTLSFDEVNLTSGNTTISAGNAVNDNTWGYAWDGATTYSAPSASDNTLISATNLSEDISFTKTLAFAAKFANTAETGHYKTNGTLSLTTSPKEATVITMANLTEMQQLAEGYAPDACKNTIIPDGQDYAGPYTLKDVRDGNTYTVYKFKDNKCWMTENLKLWNSNTGSTFYYTGGRVLNSTTSDISADWTLPASSVSGFSDDAAANAYYDESTGNGYYTWCAATANSCSSATAQGANATSSICPKGWKLPTGMATGVNTTNDFYNLFKNMSLTISSNLSATNSTGWGTGDLDIAQKSPYNFAYTGNVDNGTFYDPASNQVGRWWSRTAVNSTGAYSLYVGNSYVTPGIYANSRYAGFAVRCLAE